MEDIKNDTLSSKTLFVIGDNNDVDVDTVCACEAYSNFLNARGVEAKHTQNIQLSELQDAVLKLCQLDKPEYLEVKNPAQIDQDTFENEFIILKPQSLQTLHPNITPKNIVGIISTFKPEYIEHLPEEEFSNYNTLQFEVVGSVSTLIAEKFKHTNTPINSNIASLLMVGIILNTNGLEEEQTYDRDFVAIEYLEEFANIRKDQINALVNQL